MYQQDPAEIRGLVAGSLDGALQQIDDNQDRFCWRWYGTPENRAAMRAEAAEAFFADRARHPGRYIAGVLPALPFADGAFDLALSSCLLFTWVSRVDEAWHRAALVELARVAAEVRVYPLVAAGAGEPVPFLIISSDRCARTGTRRRCGRSSTSSRPAQITCWCSAERSRVVLRGQSAKVRHRRATARAARSPNAERRAAASPATSGKRPGSVIMVTVRVPA